MVVCCLLVVVVGLSTRAVSLVFDAVRALILAVRSRIVGPLNIEFAIVVRIWRFSMEKMEEPDV